MDLSVVPCHLIVWREFISPSLITALTCHCTTHCVRAEPQAKRCCCVLFSLPLPVLTICVVFVCLPRSTMPDPQPTNPPHPHSCPFRHINRDAARTHGLSNITPTIDCLVKSCRSTRYHTTFHPNFPSRSRRTFGGTSLKLTWRSRYAT